MNKDEIINELEKGIIEKWYTIFQLITTKDEANQLQETFNTVFNIRYKHCITSLSSYDYDSNDEYTLIYRQEYLNNYNKFIEFGIIKFKNNIPFNLSNTWKSIKLPYFFQGKTIAKKINNNTIAYIRVF